MKLRKRLEWTLQQVQSFHEPRLELEQYTTSAELASGHLLFVNETKPTPLS